jgi:phage gpG-like protein
VFEFTIVSTGTEVAASFIEGMGTRAAAPRPALEEIYATVLDIIGETFDDEGARGGFPKWADDTEQWIYEKARHGGDSRILRDTGELFHDATSFRSSGMYTRIERDRIILTPRTVKGKVAQVGTTDGSHPARPFIRFTYDDQQAFAREILRHIMGRGRKV